MDPHNQNRWMPNSIASGKETRIRETLGNVAGVSFTNEHEGRFETGCCEARVRIGPSKIIQFDHLPDDPPSPEEALQRNGDLPGNVRFALAREKVALLADTQVDGRAHLARTVQEIGAGLEHALSCNSHAPKRDQKPIKTKQVETALEKLREHDDEMVVDLSDGWEMRPRMHGTRTAIRMDIADDGDMLRLHRVVLADWPEGFTRTAVAMQALVYNAQIRLSRLSSTGGIIVAESHLHDGQIDSLWISTTARAVTVAALHSSSVLEILARQKEVATHYYQELRTPKGESKNGAVQCG